MNIKKLLTGIWFLIWVMFSLLITAPIWILIFAYDLGNPKDGEDRIGKYFEAIFAVGGCKL